jgi:hypothetical protein
MYGRCAAALAAQATLSAAAPSAVKASAGTVSSGAYLAWH